MTRPVGYGSPPNHTKWQKGQSGNPSGRRRGQRNLATIIRDELARKVRGADGKEVTMFELIGRQLVAKVAKGELRWLPLLVRFAQIEEPLEPEPTLGRKDNALMAEFLAAFKREEDEK